LTQLAGRHPDRIQGQINFEHQFAAIYSQRAYVRLPLLAKIRRLEQSFLSPVESLRPP